MCRPKLHSKELAAVFALAVLALSILGCGKVSQSLTGPTPMPSDEAGLITSTSQILGQGAVKMAASGTYRGEIAVRRPHARFTITNSSDPGVRISEMILDLKSTNGNVLFDVMPGAPGTGWCYPLYTDDGWEVGMTSWHGVNDGSTSIRLTFDLFDPGKTFEFRIDVDRLIPGSYEQFVSGADFTGARITLLFTKAESGQTPLVSESLTTEYIATGDWTAGF